MENKTRDKQIIDLYLNRNSMQAVGLQFGLSRERIRQILNKYEVKIRYYTSKHYPRQNRIFHGYILSNEERFWLQVNKSTDNGCWVWEGKLHKTGYGFFCFNSRTYYAHRLAFQFANGHEPENWCLHKCDNPPCVNPAHLYDGTPRQNANDRELRKQGIKKYFL